MHILLTALLSMTFYIQHQEDPVKAVHGNHPPPREEGTNLTAAPCGKNGEIWTVQAGLARTNYPT